MDDRHHNYRAYLPEGEAEKIYQEMLNAEGLVIDIKEFMNFLTGEPIRFTEVNITRYNPATEMPEIIDRHSYPIGIDGNPILCLEDASICHVCGQVVSKLQSVVDPFCGKTLCLLDSAMVELEEGLILRVCKECAKAVKRQQLKQKILDFIFRRKK